MPDRRKLPAIAAAVIGGSFMAMQARANSGLGQEIGSGIFAALVSFSVGLIIIGVFTLVVKKNRTALSQTINKLSTGDIPWFFILAGSIGGFFVIMQGVVAGIVGIALFSIGVVAGSAIAALVLDGYGLFGLTRRAIGLKRIAGILVALTGLMIASDLGSHVPSPLIALPFLAGIGIGFQQAMNGKFGKLAESPAVPTLFNFLAGTAFIAIALLVIEGFQFPTSWPANPLFYLGGVLGVIYIFMQVLILPRIGALSMGISMLVGQLTGSVLLDVFLPIAPHPVTISTLLGIALTMLGAALVAKR
ncbi:MAG: DMT family transporter [Aquiluna sp.]